MSADVRVFGGMAAAIAAALFAQPVAAASAMAIAPAKIDASVARAMRSFQVPGMAVGIVKDGKLIFAKGYGVREIDKIGAVDAETLFQIGSNTKAFTAAALAILVDEGKIHWDGRVSDFLPEFQMYDPYVTREFTIRDLLTHRSGLGTGAGDLMFFPATDFTRAEVIHGLRYLKPASSFRSRWDYDNLLYMVAGEIIPVVTGQSWEVFVKERILKPLGMQPCAPSYALLEDRRNVASPHQLLDDKIVAIPPEDISVIGAAGTISCNITGMSRWLVTQLAAGKLPDGQLLFSADRSEEMWSINSIQTPDPGLASLTRTHFLGYGLGWELQDEFGYKRVSHTGGVPGTVTWVSMIPELRLGVLVFTNQESGAAMEAVGNQILDAYVGAPKRDWVAMAVAYKAQRASEATAIEAEATKTAASASPPTLSLDAYAGQYSDAWRGAATVSRDGDHLVLKFSRTRGLEGSLSPYGGNIFIARWNNRRLNADAYIRFAQGYDGKVQGMTMQAISPATDFSFDFQDLDFKRVSAPDASQTIAK